MSGLSGLSALGGKAAVDVEDDNTPSSSEMSSFSEYADDLFDAIKADNRAKFTTALKKAVSACYPTDMG